MNVYLAAQWTFAALVVLPALVAFFSDNLVRTAYLFFLSLIGVAGMYALSGNDVLAAGQIIVYVGGILILLLFGVMLSTRVWRKRPASTRPANTILGTAAAIGVFFALYFHIPKEAGANVRGESLTVVGVLNLTEYLPLFEGVSLLLLAALIGAATLARKK